MAEVLGRCGRRKQRNPRRKNAVENDDQSDETTALGADPQTELSVRKRSTLPSENGSQKTCEEKTEDKKENSISFSNTNLDTATAVVAQKDLPKGEKPVEKGSIEKEDQEKEVSSTTCAEKEGASDKDSEKDVPADEKKDEKAKEGKEEEERMEKYLAGTDTVVIYPEPVSDHEDTENQDELPTTTEEEYTLKCVHCSETFTRAPVLRDHMRASHPDKPVKYQCPKCEETFSLKSHLDKHLALHSPTSQVCKVCNKTFANVYRLQRHMISHDESTDLRKFKCPECGKAFKFKHHLKEHIRIHSGEKPFECANCGKRFSHSGSYSSHMNSKKCWVLNMKGRRIDRNGNSDAVNGLLYRPVGATFSPTVTVGGSLQSPPPGAYPGQFLKYDARGPVVPALYSPPMTTAGFAAAYSMLAAGKHIPLPAHHHPPSIIPSSLPPPSPITCPKPPDMALSMSSRSQISPDVNFNTQLFCLSSGDKALALNKSSTKEEKEEKPLVKEEKELSEKEVKKEPEDEEDGEREKQASESSDKTAAASKDGFVCRHCNLDFKSPVELHQHERYLCKLNKDIVQHMPSSASTSTAAATTVATTTTAHVSDNCASPGSATSMSDLSRHTTPSGSHCDTATDEEDGEESAGPEGKKYRMRSLISEEQQTILKARYRENPRPDKNELVKIATEVGFSKRVVQVWFQNMRARDRRRGKEVPYFPNMARFKMGEGGISTTAPSTTSSSGSSIPAYIPIVPQIFTSSSISSMAADSGSKLNSAVRSLSTMGGASEMPLDLSVKKQPPLAHSNSSSPAPSVSPYQCQDQALNLSKKSPSSTSKEEVSDKDAKPVKDSSIRFQHSSIFKYLQQEGLIRNSLKVPKDDSSSSSSKPTFPATSDRVQMALNIRSHLLARKNQNSPSKTNGHADDDKDSSPEEQPTNPANKESAETKTQQDDSDANESRLVIDECPPEKEDEDMENEDDDDDDDDSTDEDTSAGEADSQQQAYHTGQHNLETLAAVASLEELKQQLGEGTGKSLPKRLRRKSWRQVNMESDEFIVDFDDAVSTEDEDGPQRKRRKSWRGHKVDAELGMYACDQCDKMFSKQSSLARHKYEHSGARPFTCEVCTKAFKHKHHLTEHRRLHSGEKPFQCKKCGKRFSHSGSYSQHMNHRYKYCKPSDGEDE